MDKAELLKLLLSDPETAETLKKILAEDEKPKRKPVKKKPVKKAVPTPTTPVRKRVTKDKKLVKEPEENFRTDYKEKEEVVLKEFVDDLTLAVTEIIDGEEVNLIDDSKKFSKKMKRVKPKVRERAKSKETSKTCECGAKFKSFGYLCDKCLKGRSINA